MSNKIKEKTLVEIYKDEKWHTWKCRCGCLNNRSRGNCSHCGVEVNAQMKFYGNGNYVIEQP
jgi:hypothetical protein